MAKTVRKPLLKIYAMAIIVAMLALASSCAAPASTTPTVSPKTTPAASVSPSTVPVSTTPAASPPPTQVTTQTATPSPPANPSPTPGPQYTYIGKALCTANEFVNIRAKADSNSEILGKLPAGKTADVIKYYDNWAHITYAGITGYVSRSYIVGISAPKISIPSGEWTQILVNPTHLLPDGFSVKLADFQNGKVDARILEICEAMFADAKKDGVTLQLVDAYRSYERQSELYWAKVESYLDKGYSQADAENTAATITARPNTSEHQTGLALDIVTPSYKKMNKGFADTQAFKWLNANAHKYGFTLRYPSGKSDVTKVIYEPWHWRFVGVETAKELKSSGLCLEEYLGETD